MTFPTDKAAELFWARTRGDSGAFSRPEEKRATYVSDVLATPTKKQALRCASKVDRRQKGSSRSIVEILRGPC